MIRLCVALAIVGCHHPSVANQPDAPGGVADAPADGAIGANPLGLSCAVTTTAFAPAECPPPSGASGQATFCYRPQWPGVTSVEVLGGFGKTTDWTAPLVTLAAQGDGTWSATVPLTGGPYPYIFRVQGATDISRAVQFAIDQLNPSFVPAPAASPYKRSVSQLTLPQVAAPIHHLTGSVVQSGAAQPCFVAMIDVGELRKTGGAVLSEHGTANFVEIGPDGTFDVPVADGPVLVDVRYPFGLTTTYPDPMTTASIGDARTGATISGADVALEPTDVTYPTSGYAGMTPVGGTTAPVPISFAWTLAPNASGSYMSVTGTNIAGNDPLYTSGTFGAATTQTWDGSINSAPGAMAKSGTTYYWATWQKRGMWVSESLELPIKIQ